jgi:hypothetical protein
MTWLVCRKVSNGATLKNEVYHKNHKVEFFRHLSGSSKKGTKDLLAFGKLTTAHKVGAIESHDTVNDKETVLVCSEVGGKTFQQFGLHLFLSKAGLGASVRCSLPRCFGHGHRRYSRKLDQGRLEYSATTSQNIFRVAYHQTALQSLGFSQDGMFPRCLFQGQQWSFDKGGRLTNICNFAFCSTHVLDAVNMQWD